MSIETATATQRRLHILPALVVLLTMSVAAPSGAATGEGRSSVTNHNSDQYGPLELQGVRQKSAQTTENPDSGAPTAMQQILLFDFWIYDADVVLFSDDDGDGYFYGIDLLLDADTIYGAADVYAAVYLSLEGGPWNEYAVTDDFSIFGESGDDEYILVTELMSGYPTGRYDLLIELFDAFDGSFLASFGPEDTSALSALPLEDFNRDAPGFDRPVNISRGGGGGSAGYGFLLLLLSVLLLRAQACKKLRQLVSRATVGFSDSGI